MATRIIWSNPKTDLLVSEKRKRNNKYHTRFRANKTEFWQSVGQRIHRRYNSTYTAYQCEQKWRNLVRNYDVSK